ncbi:hypothetical protein K440DRAFT_201205 [Wilcoxina mikolae CBS 423.85]|nr:hypothetical protein K440DRAFT_201205 [Wilcoxina mikolae CBS 423.85]
MAKQTKTPQLIQSKNPSKTAVRSRPLPKKEKKKATTTTTTAHAAHPKNQSKNNAAREKQRIPTPSAPRKAQGIELLPLEITYMFLDLLPNRDLISLSQTNHHFHSVLSEPLYKRFLTARIPWKDRLRPNQIYTITPLEWAASTGRSELLKRLMVDKKITLADHMRDHTYSRRLLVSRAAESGDEDTLLLALKSARELGVSDEELLSGYSVISSCKSEKCIGIVLEELEMRSKKSRRGR